MQQQQKKVYEKSKTGKKKKKTLLMQKRVEYAGLENLDTALLDKGMDSNRFSQEDSRTFKKKVRFSYSLFSLQKDETNESIFQEIKFKDMR